MSTLRLLLLPRQDQAGQGLAGASIPSYVEDIDYDGKAQRAEASIRPETMRELVDRHHWTYDDLASGVWHVFRPDY
jgi:hypothetical protein